MKRRKPNNIALLKKKLWDVFSLYVKTRDKWTCITCGRFARGGGMGGGHYIAKAACGLDYYFSERNVHAQCTYCNLTLEGNRPSYRAFILGRYGRAALLDIERNYHKPCKWTAEDFKGKIAHYEAETAKLVVQYI